MIERMQALMQAAETSENKRGHRVLCSRRRRSLHSCSKATARAHCSSRACRGSDGRMRVLAVLDLASDTLKAETRRLAAADGSGPAVEISDWQRGSPCAGCRQAV